jgi:hypothetical protein
MLGLLAVACWTYYAVSLNPPDFDFEPALLADPDTGRLIIDHRCWTAYQEVTHPVIAVLKYLILGTRFHIVGIGEGLGAILEQREGWHLVIDPGA